MNGICAWCQLADLLDELLVGDVDRHALRARLLAAARPDRIVIWLYARHARGLLRGLATGTVPLTHPGLDGFVNRQAADHVRGLLVAVGLLPKRDDGLARFDRWVASHLAEHAATADEFKMLSQFATWQFGLSWSSESAGRR